MDDAVISAVACEASFATVCSIPASNLLDPGFSLVEANELFKYDVHIINI